MSNESKFENEYKNYKVDFIQLLDELDEGRWAHEPDMRAELDEVYAQAAKTDEYEAKAAAFDEIMFTVKNVKRDTPFNTTVRNIVRQYEKEYESGESDV